MRATVDDLSPHGVYRLGRYLGRISEDGSISVEMLPLIDILDAEGFDRLDGLKVDVEGFKDRVLVPFFRDAPDSLLPEILIAEHFNREHWETDWTGHARSRGYRESERTDLNVVMVRDRRSIR